MFTTDLVNLYNRNIFKTSLYIYIFQDENVVLCAIYLYLWIYLNSVEARNLKITLKGVSAKNERGYRLNAIKKRFWSILISLQSVASIRRKLLKTTNTEERSIHTNSEIYNMSYVAYFWICMDTTLDRKKIYLISNKSFRYYNL